ncbi:cytochrome P450 [Thamnocephalis sphaerospora]|uniref:Cytochrome P450 n=1 Tax=Thamnocephalis sphaerospora TaxID=78915 RepID=A0A4P9XIF9_9FUNG|nr:cytochrome P450 [Thamnocephalis sphaerospora]|eukprot:RKP05483.1 cytochrome P450 [Thamnocephalis sphaerospora]
MLSRITDEVNECTAFIDIFPFKWMGRLFAPLVNDVYRHYRIIENLVLPEIERRRIAARADPKYTPPVDLLQFMLEFNDKNGDPNSTKDLTSSLMLTAFGAIATNVFIGTHFMYDVAAHPEVRERMYEEQQRIIAKYGTAFSKEALRDMSYMESCLRETLRLNTHAIGTFRKMMTGFTFSNGLSVPAGRLCLVHTRAVNRNDKVYENANEYIPERVADPTNPRAATSVSGYVTFGMGEFGCPGRHFAVGQLKALMAVLIRRYDFTTKSGKRPKDKIQRVTEYLPIDEAVIFTPRA